MQQAQKIFYSSFFLFLLWLSTELPLSAQSTVNVLTSAYDNSRASANLNETILSTLNVNSAQFGKLFSLPVTGFINAQPLYMSNVPIIGKGTHNVVFVATHHNDVYAFDADTAGASLWQVNLGPSVPAADYALTDLTEIGIMSTPVIDPNTNTLYCVALTKENGVHIYRLHALDVTSGQEKFMGPVEISATVAGNSTFDSKNGQVTLTPDDELQRPGLVLVNNAVYIGFGSHNDSGIWHGWLIGYNAANVQQQIGAVNTSPGGWGASIWQSGRAPAVDADGNIYYATGNGTFDGLGDWGESVVKLSTASGVPTLADWFTPDDWSHLNDLDNDFGSCGPILTSAGWLIAGGKDGIVYVMARQNLGHTQTGNNQVLQHFQAIGFGIYTSAYWDRRGGPILYLRADGDVPKAFQITTDYFQTTPVSQASASCGLPLDGMAVSANGSAPYSGIMWLACTTDGNENGPGILHAYDALDLSKELWNSNMNGARDSFGTLGKFAPPTVANGKVYLATFSGSLMVYGLLSEKIAVGQVVNAASGQGGAVAPGEMISIDGADLGPATLTTNLTNLATTGMLSRQLGGTQVMINGNPAALLTVRQDQVTAVVPDAVAGQKNITLQVQYQGQTTATMSIPVATEAPGIFALNGSGMGQGAIVNQNDTINSASNPAARGSIIALFGTGQGPTNPSWNDDALATAPYPQISSSVSVTIGGQSADVIYAGAAPGSAAVFQINVKVPQGVTPGSQVPVIVTIGGAKTQSGVTMAVQ